MWIDVEGEEGAVNWWRQFSTLLRHASSSSSALVFTYLYPHNGLHLLPHFPTQPSPSSPLLSSPLLPLSISMACSDPTSAPNPTTTSPSSPHSLSPPSSSTPPPPTIVLSPCAACKILRRRCAEKCVLAPYFPPTDPAKFTTAHRVFGASNIIKFLQVKTRTLKLSHTWFLLERF